MAIIYFTSTAATGDGTLREAILSASDGDVIIPDPDVFGIGQTIDVALAGSISPTAAITIDAGGRNLILRHSIPIYARAGDGCASLVVNGVTFAGRVICAGQSGTPQTATFNRCTFGSFTASAAVMQISTGYVSGVFNDCLFTGSLTYGVYLSGEGTATTFNRCTIAGNVGAAFYGNAKDAAVKNDSIVDPDLTTAGFIGAPTDVSGYSTSNLPPWESWDFRLTQSSPYATGATSAAGQYDRDGVKRGQTGGGYALGAYEANGAAFWIGRDADGAAVESPKWNAADGWASSPCATRSDLSTAPLVVCLVNQTIEFTDAPNLGRLIVANAAVTLDAEGGGSIANAELGINGRLVEANDLIDALRIASGAVYSGSWGDVTTAALLPDATVDFIADAQLNALELSAGATIRIADGKLVGVTTATLGAGTITAPARAYFAVSPSTDVSAATITNVILTPRGAGLTSFEATGVNGTATFQIEQTNGDVPVLLEVLDGGGWSTVSTEATSETTAPIGDGVSTFRVCDGVAFLVDSTVQVAEYWTVEAWPVNESGGGSDTRSWAVQCWGIDPQIDHN